MTAMALTIPPMRPRTNRTPESLMPDVIRRFAFQHTSRRGPVTRSSLSRPPARAAVGCPLYRA